MSDRDEHSTLRALAAPRIAFSQKKVLTAIGPFGVTSVSLPESGTFTIGRSDECDLSLEDPQISRRHATLHLGAETSLEDHGGPNGTTVGGVLINNQKVPLGAGQLIELASTLIVIQRSHGSSGQKRVWPHDYFEIRVEEECSAAPGHVFSVLFVVAEFEEDAVEAEKVINDLLGPQDVVARYALGQYELFLPSAGRSRAEQLGQNIEAAIAEREAPLRFGTASFPADGKSADALLHIARTRARGALRDDQQEALVVEPAMIDLYRVAERVAQGRISVLLLGETGVGKERLAEHIHRSSPRREQPFVRINCGALTETLLESELFGHEKGAFTGAEVAKQGLLESAHQGTMFLDEVGELPPATQIKLLRGLEQREVLRVGALKPRPVDVRFVAATNRNLEQQIALGTFRQDLYFRINGATLTIPPLRERTSEIERLAKRFLSSAARENGDEDAPELSSRALELLSRYDWPGNIRELRNVIERATLLCMGDSIEPEHLPLEKMRSTPLAAAPRVEETEPSRRVQVLSERERTDRQRVIDALELYAGNQTRAAKHLGVSRRTLVKKIIKYDLPRPRV